MSFVRLTSKDNPLLKQFRSVLSQAHRAPAGLVVAEGLRTLEELTVSGQEIEAVLVSETFGKAAREAALTARLESRGVRLYRAPERLMAGISDVRAPQGAIALVRMPKLTLADIGATRDPLLLCACGVQDPGNMGTLVRAAAAAAASLVCTTRGTVSARNPKAIRASAGTYFRVPVVEQVDPADFLAYCGRNRIQIYGTSASAGIPYFKVDFRGPVAVLLGNEANGLPLEDCGNLASINIPMAKGVESLNVGAAGAVLFFEAYRQRSRRIGGTEK
jgi:TrmH family RNA methyltransferase